LSVSLFRLMEKITFERTTGDDTDWVPGDYGYLTNKTSPHRIEWDGENMVFLGLNTFWGHGIGIRTSQGIVEKFREMGYETALEPWRKFTNIGLAGGK
jgi:hypothetical protein